jgi:hypothetical protein
MFNGSMYGAPIYPDFVKRALTQFKLMPKPNLSNVILKKFCHAQTTSKVGHVREKKKKEIHVLERIKSTNVRYLQKK